MQKMCIQLHQEAMARRGLTLIELMLGMIVTTVTLGAIAALFGAVGQGWKQSESIAGTTNTSGLANLRMQHELKNVRQIGAVRAGSSTGASDADALLWAADNNSDYQVQFSELALLEYHSATTGDDPQTLRLYTVTLPLGASDTTLSSEDDIYQNSEIDTFKSLQYVNYTVLARNVTSAQFKLNDGALVARPSLDYVINLKQGSEARTILGAVAVRTPSTLPASQSGG